MNTVHYGSMEEFQTMLAQNGFVPVRYKDCNCHGGQEYFINEDCTIIHLLSSRKRAKKPFEAAWHVYTYNPNKSKNNMNRHLVYIGFSAQLHRVVANTFLGNAPSDTKNRIRFKDGNFDNCHPSNLEWCSHGDAMNVYFSKKKGDNNNA